MPAKPKPGFAAAAVADAKKAAPSPDALKKLKEHIRVVRNLSMEIDDAQQRLDELSQKRHALLSKTLPDMFTELGIKTLELEAEGNVPAWTARAAPYYKANIAANWPDDKRKKAFEWLRKNRLGDIIKVIFEVELGRGTEKKQKEVRTALKKLKVPFTVGEQVPHTTLTAVFRSMVEKEGKTPPLDILGASMGTAVQVKVSKPATQTRSKSDGI